MKLLTTFSIVFFILAFQVSQASSEEWIKSPTRRTLGTDGGGGGTYFSKIYSKRKGKFKAMYGSIFDTRDSVSGEFMVGKFRYVYSPPIGGEEDDLLSLPLHDELISEVLMDCKAFFFGTIKQTFKYKGKVIGYIITEDKDILMMQLSGNSTVGDLCDFLKIHGVEK